MVKEQKFKAIMVKDFAHKRFVETVGYGQKHTERLIELLDNDKNTKESSKDTKHK